MEMQRWLCKEEMEVLMAQHDSDTGVTNLHKMAKSSQSSFYKSQVSWQHK